MTQTGYPHGRPGYVVDHIIPLKRGGADAPWNMQWQTIAAGKSQAPPEWRAGLRGACGIHERLHEAAARDGRCLLNQKIAGLNCL
jgi:hypothetical protein